MLDKDTGKKELKGVVCDAFHCVHHGDHNSCHARSISVGPHSACCTSETVCATFEPKDDPITGITGRPE